MSAWIWWVLGGLAVVGGIVATVWTDQAPYPYAQRWILNIPLPFLSRRRLGRILAPRPGERILELGPGTGLQSLYVAPLLGDAGRLDIVDIQQSMLDHVMARAGKRGLRNIVPNRADAHDLPFADATFDAAYLVTVLGEIPEPARTLAELRRVLRPGGRLVVGEFADKHHIPLTRLIRHANGSGLHFDRRLGVPLAFYASFDTCPAPVGAHPRAVGATLGS